MAGVYRVQIKKPGFIMWHLTDCAFVSMHIFDLFATFVLFLGFFCFFLLCEGCTFANICCYSHGEYAPILFCLFCKVYSGWQFTIQSIWRSYWEHGLPLWLANHFIVWAIFYFTVVWDFIWRAKCSLGSPQWNNILPWLCKTITLSFFISGLCLGWLRRRSSLVIYGCWITRWYCGFDLTCTGASSCL